MREQYLIRAISEEEYPALYAADEVAFHSTWPAAEAVRHQLLTFEPERSLAVFDGPQIVGGAGSYGFTLTVPGSSAPAAGVTAVAVLPSHRRRGILTALMRRQLDDLRKRGEAVAVLWASEAGIYRRYGYGPGSWHATFTIRRGEGGLVAAAPSDPGLRLRIAQPQAARPELAKIYETVLPTRPGLFARSDRYWDSILDDPEYHRQGTTALRCVIAEDAAGARGYALTRSRPGWTNDGLPDATVLVTELMAGDPAATAALWTDLLTRDLASQTIASLRPVDDPLLVLLADPRRARSQVADGLWVRVVDVGTALTQRRYRAPVDAVIDVADEFCPWNSGRWRLAAGSAGPGTCERTTAPADVALPAHALGAAYLGGTGLAPLAAAGLVTELRPGAVAALSAALSWDPAPWCPVIF